MDSLVQRQFFLSSYLSNYNSRSVFLLRFWHLLGSSPDISLSWILGLPSSSICDSSHSRSSSGANFLILKGLTVFANFLGDEVLSITRASWPMEREDKSFDWHFTVVSICNCWGFLDYCSGVSSIVALESGELNLGENCLATVGFIIRDLILEKGMKGLLSPNWPLSFLLLESLASRLSDFFIKLVLLSN